MYYFLLDKLRNRRIRRNVAYMRDQAHIAWAARLLRGD